MVNLRFLLFALCASFAAIRSARLYVEHGASKALWCGEECAYKDPKHFVWRGPYGRELSLGSQQYTVSNFSEGKAGNYTCEWMDMLCSRYTLDLQGTSASIAASCVDLCNRVIKLIKFLSALTQFQVTSTTPRLLQNNISVRKKTLW